MSSWQYRSEGVSQLSLQMPKLKVKSHVWEILLPENRVGSLLPFSIFHAPSPLEFDSPPSIINVATP